MIDIKDEEKLQMLVDNQSELNYRELTNFLELPYLRGCSKDKQLSELSKICKIEKDKTKYKITEIYNSALIKFVKIPPILNPFRVIFTFIFNYCVT